MNNLCKTILASWQVRRTKAQKTAFIQMLQENIPGLRIEEGGFMKSRNLIVGDPESAKVIFTAHYDTPPQSFIPNFVAPDKRWISILISLATVVPLLVLTLLANAIVVHFHGSELLRRIVVLGVYFGLFFLQFFASRPNPNNANDNTSGVCFLVHMIQELSPEQRKNAAFIFFDNEEYGCVGSGYYYKKHKQMMRDKLIFNLDCVADGDHFMFVMKENAIEQWEPLLKSCFPAAQGKTVRFASAKDIKYSSDHKHFPMSVGVESFNLHPSIGLYFSRIHTKNDIVFQEENIDYLVSGAKELIELINN